MITNDDAVARHCLHIVEHSGRLEGNMFMDKNKPSIDAQLNAGRFLSVLVSCNNKPCRQHSINPTNLSSVSPCI